MYQVTLAALRIGKECGIKTIFNPAPAQADLAPEFFSTPDILCTPHIYPPPTHTHVHACTHTHLHTYVYMPALYGSSSFSVALSQRRAGNCMTQVKYTHITSSMHADRTSLPEDNLAACAQCVHCNYPWPAIT